MNHLSKNDGFDWAKMGITTNRDIDHLHGNNENTNLEENILKITENGIFCDFFGIPYPFDPSLLFFRAPFRNGTSESMVWSKPLLPQTTNDILERHSH
jgi:hypothetical protein